jgi:hypothetical protein
MHSQQHGKNEGATGVLRSDEDCRFYGRPACGPMLPVDRNAISTIPRRFRRKSWRAKPLAQAADTVEPATL